MITKNKLTSFPKVSDNTDFVHKIRQRNSLGNLTYSNIKSFFMELLSFNSVRAKVINFSAIILILRIIPTEKIGNYCIFSKFILPNLMITCPTTGLFSGCTCPACGLTRAVSHALHLNFQEAWDMNKLVIIVLPLIIILLMINLFKLLMKSIPNMFEKRPIPDNSPKALKSVIKKVSKEKTKELALKTAYKELSKEYWGGNINTISRFLDFFHYRIKELVKKKGFLHCTNLDYLLRFILIKSGKFAEEDIFLSIQWIGGWFPHQYLTVKVSKNKTINVDLWGKRYGIKFGYHIEKFPKKL